MKSDDAKKRLENEIAKTNREIQKAELDDNFVVIIKLEAKLRDLLDKYGHFSD